MKEQIDIEQLLEWAYRLQCVDKRVKRAVAQRPARYPSSSPFAAFADLGTRVDTFGFQSPDVTAVQEDDAMLVHDAVLALPDVWLEWRGADEAVIWTRETAAAWGYVLEKQRFGWAAVRQYSPADAEPDHVYNLEFISKTVLVIQYAREGLRPDVWEGVTAPASRPPSAGAVDRRGRRRKSADIALEFEAAIHARAIYIVWRWTLQKLTVDLAGQLSRYEPAMPSAPESPWLRGPKVIKKAHFCQKYFPNKILEGIENK